MTSSPALTLGAPGVDQFSPAQLLRTARLFASDPELRTVIDPDEGAARWVELDSGPDHQIWLLSWPTGTENGWHDHGESASAFQVVRGTLLEQTSNNHRREFRTIIAGEGRALEPNQIHHLANVRTGSALSVHVYAPRLTTTTRYAITPTGLQSGAAVEAQLDW
ncbi:MAG: cysteine dioxygenase family protein [Actinomycetota bacterium]